MKLVIFAGGFGTRISEESDYIPKPMVKIGKKPILWHIIKYYSIFGFSEFIICGGYKIEIIKKYFKNHKKKIKWNIQVINTAITNISSSLSLKNNRNNKLSVQNMGLKPISLAKNRKIKKFSKKNYNKFPLLYKKWFIFPNAKRQFLKKKLNRINLKHDFYLKEKQEFGNSSLVNTSRNRFILADKAKKDSLKSTLFNRLDKNLKQTISTSLKKSKTTVSLSKSRLKYNSVKETNSMFPINLHKFKAYNLSLRQNKEKKCISIFFMFQKKVRTLNATFKE
jgi:hypothetical protein